MKHIITLIVFIALTINPLSVFAQNENRPEIKFIGEAENIGRNINTKYSELLPIISPDGKILYFVRNGDPLNIGESDYKDIWYSKKNNGYWTKAKNIGEPLNNWKPNAILSITPDGNTVILLNNYNTEEGVCFSEKTSKGWSEPKLFIIPKYKNYHKNSGGAFISNDKKYILFSVEGEDTEGKHDIYVSKKLSNNKWSEPINLGNVINTEGVEISPFLASDSKTLFFSSTGHEGYGSCDIFMSQRLDDSWTNWSEPINLGEKINTEGFDAYFSIPASGNVAYFTREGENNQSNIYYIKLKPFIKSVLIFGYVLDKKTNKPIQCQIRFERLSDGKEVGRASTNPNTGEYKITLPCGEKYNIRAECECYMAQTEYENLSTGFCDKYEEKRHDIKMINICKEEWTDTLRIKVFFDRDSSVLRKESVPELKYLTKMLNENPNWKIEINGHTCDIGSKWYNLRLSKKRAIAVYDYLIEHGIDKKRLSCQGFGESHPICKDIDFETNEISEECRKKNRRVEVVIKSKKRKRIK